MTVTRPIPSVARSRALLALLVACGDGSRGSGRAFTYRVQPPDGGALANFFFRLVAPGTAFDFR